MTSTYTYKNGFRLIYQKADSKIPLTSILVFVKFGSIHESDRHGVAHFIEHMCFKGTDKRPTTKEITTPYDKVGAYINASTYKEHTDYIVKCNDEYVDNCIGVLVDMIFHSKFQPKHLALEQNIVKEETIRLNDDPEAHISNMTERLLYTNTPYERPIDDLSYHAETFPNIQVLEMYRRFYQPQNMGMSVVSNLPFETIKHMVSRHLSYRTSRPIKIERMPLIIPGLPRALSIDIRKKKSIQATHLNLAFRTCEYGHSDMYKLHVLANILGGYMSSQMFELLREKHGVTYKSTCTVDCYQSAGHLSLYTMCDPTKMMRNSENIGVLALLIQLIRGLHKNGVSAKELVIAKGNLKGKYTQNLENCQNPCFHNGLEYIVYDKREIVPYSELYATYYANITVKDIAEVIEKYMRHENLVVCLFGEHVPVLSDVEKEVRKW